MQDDSAEMLMLIEQNPLATVVRKNEPGLVADHIPLLLDKTPTGAMRLIGHVAKANPLWQSTPEQEHLLIFQGPQCYISPNGYATKALDGRVVPTWNYAAVHVTARVQAICEPKELLQILTALTQRLEAKQPKPWAVSDAPADYIEKLLAHIVGLRFDVVHMQGKWKVSQNQPVANRASLVTALAQSTQAMQQSVAGLIQSTSADGAA